MTSVASRCRFRVKDKVFARIREEGDVLVVWVSDLGEQEALIASEPKKFFTTPHCDGHPTLAAENLTLEITESAMMHDTETAVARLKQLKELGINLAVDDFGTGYSSLSYLQRFPIDILKIDQSFVAGIDGDAEQSALARAIVRLAQTLQLAAVAEGVETERQLERLRELGCRYAQGFFLALPQDAEALGEVLKAAAVGGQRDSAA